MDSEKEHRLQAGSYHLGCTAISRTSIWILVGDRSRAMPLILISLTRSSEEASPASNLLPAMPLILISLTGFREEASPASRFLPPWLHGQFPYLDLHPGRSSLAGDAFDFDLLDSIQRRSIACEQAPTGNAFDVDLLDCIQRRSIACKQTPTGAGSGRLDKV